ncbi:MAG: hypothetical protein AAB458_02235 [Patescibacteria group bacterium]
MRQRNFGFILLFIIFVVAPSMATTTIHDDPVVLDGNFAWDTAASSQCVLFGSPGNESALTFFMNGGEFEQKSHLYPPVAEAGAQFGRRVSISSGCRVAVICAPRDDQRGVDGGVAFVLEGPGDGSFTHLQTLYGSDTDAGDNFCSDVSLTQNGLGVVIGASYVDKVYVFTRGALGQMFGNEKKFTYTGDDVGGLAGYSVCAGGDPTLGTMMSVVGIPISYNNDGTDDWFGAIEVREQNRGGANNWGVRNRITFTNAERLGWSVACSREDNLAIAGAPLDMTAGGGSGFAPETTGQGRGKVYVFKLEGSVSFSILQTLISTSPQDDGEFGRAVSYDDASNTLLVTEPFADVSGFENQGRAFLYHDNSSLFVRDLTFLPTHQNSFEEIGLSAFVRGGRAFVGSPYADFPGQIDSGGAYVVPTAFFRDGFESGNMSAWSSTVP